MNQRAIIAPVNGKTPKVDDTAFVAPTAVVLGGVELGPEASVWYGSVLRGDINYIRIGARTSVQDNCVVHVAKKGPGTTVGKEAVVGHRVVLHSCQIGDGVLIGMGAVVMDWAQVGEGALVAAGALVPSGMSIPPHTLAVGSPAKIKRDLTEDERIMISDTMRRYLKVAQCHRDPGFTFDFTNYPR